MTFLNSIFICKSNETEKENTNFQQEIEKVKDDVRKLENKFSNLQQDLKSLENKIDLMKDILSSKIDTIVILINQIRQ